MSSIYTRVRKTLKMLWLPFPGHWEAVCFVWCSNSCTSTQTLLTWDTLEQSICEHIHGDVYTVLKNELLTAPLVLLLVILAAVALKRSNIAYCKCTADMWPFFNDPEMDCLGPWTLTGFSLQRKTAVSFHPGIRRCTPAGRPCPSEQSQQDWPRKCNWRWERIRGWEGSGGEWDLQDLFDFCVSTLSEYGAS